MGLTPTEETRLSTAHSKSGLPEKALAPLARHTSLEDLYLGGNRIGDAGAARLKGMTQLRRLDISGNGLTQAGVAHLAELRNLEWLDLRGSSATAEQILAHAKGWRKLTYLNLDGLKSDKSKPLPFTWTDHYLATMSEMGLLHTMPEARPASGGSYNRPKSATDVSTFTIALTKVTDAGLAHLKAFTNLTYLELNLGVTDAGLKHLYGMRSLKQVKVGPQVTADGIKQLRAALPGCEVVQ